jgi:hypothetical protein
MNNFRKQISVGQEIYKFMKFEVSLLGWQVISPAPTTTGLFAEPFSYCLHFFSSSARPILTLG